MEVRSIDANLLDAVVRLVRLTDEPASSKVLAPLIVKEISIACWPEARARASVISYCRAIRNASRVRLGTSASISINR